MGEVPDTVDDAVDLLGSSPTAYEVEVDPFVRDFSERSLASAAMARTVAGAASVENLTPALASSFPPQGALAETLPRMMCGASLGLTSGEVKMVAIRLIEGRTYTSISMFSGGTALVAGTHQIFGIYDDALGSSSGTARALLRATADGTSTAWAGNSKKTLTLTSPYTAVRTGLHYVAVLVVASTTPNLLGMAGVSNLNTLPPIAAGSVGSGLTALPDPAGALSALGSSFYAYLL